MPAMIRYTLALLLLLLLPVPSRAACVNVYLPDLAPPDGVPTGVIQTTFPVPPTTVQLFYPFNVTLDTAGTLVVTQEVGQNAAMRYRSWSGVTRVSLVSWMSYVNPSATWNGDDYGADYGGLWRRMEDSMLLLGYETLTHGPLPVGVEPTWAFREDWRVATRRFNAAMSTPLNPGTGWNVGVYAPYGIQALGLQIKMQVCQP